MRMLRVTLAGDGKPILLNPQHVVSVSEHEANAEEKLPAGVWLQVHSKPSVIVTGSLDQIEGELNAALATHGELAIEVMRMNGGTLPVEVTNPNDFSLSR